jgi:hypothetical protein
MVPLAFALPGGIPIGTGLPRPVRGRFRNGTSTQRRWSKLRRGTPLVQSPMALDPWQHNLTTSVSITYPTECEGLMKRFSWCDIHRSSGPRGLKPPGPEREVRPV